MNAPIKLAPMQAERATTFRAWRVLSTGHCQPLGEIDADTAEDASWCSMPTLQRGAQFMVEEHDAAHRTRIVRHYQVKHRANTQRRFDTTTMRMIDVGKEYPALLVEYRVDEFKPTRPFDALRDCAVGIDRGLVDRRIG